MTGFDFELVKREYAKLAVVPATDEEAYRFGWIAANTRFCYAVFPVSYRHLYQLRTHKVSFSLPEFFNAGWFAFVTFIGEEVDRLFMEADRSD